MDHVDSILRSMDVDQRRIFKEKFGGRSQAAQKEPEAEAPAGLIEFTRSARNCALSSGRTLLEVAEMNGVNIPSSCRQGQCGTCATRLQSGEVSMDCEEGLDPALKLQGYVLTCVARPRGNIRLEA
jgi:ferredoxin